MVVAGKVFKLVDPMPLDEMALKLNGYRVEELYEEGDQKFALIAEVTDLSLREGVLTGVYSYDRCVHVFQRGKAIPVMRTFESVFSFSRSNDRTLLTIVGRKRLAKLMAKELSKALTGEIGRITDAWIMSEALRSFHERSEEGTKIVFFDNVGVANVNKLSLYGPDLMNASSFSEYKGRCDLWYVVVRVKGYGYTVGVTRDASVVVFNLNDKVKYLEYVSKEIYPLVT